jgi:hypothetical protein
MTNKRPTTNKSRTKRCDAIQALKAFLIDMDRQGRIIYVDHRAKRAFFKVDGKLVEVTAANRHTFPKPAAEVPVAVTVLDEKSGSVPRPVPAPILSMPAPIPYVPSELGLK